MNYIYIHISHYIIYIFLYPFVNLCDFTKNDKRWPTTSKVQSTRQLQRFRAGGHLHSQNGPVHELQTSTKPIIKKSIWVCVKMGYFKADKYEKQRDKPSILGLPKKEHIVSPPSMIDSPAKSWAPMVPGSEKSRSPSHGISKYQQEEHPA